MINEIYYKFSYYNIVVREKDDIFYLYNLYNGGLFTLTKDEFKVVNKLKFRKDELISFDYLLVNEFIIPFELDEFNKLETILHQFKDDYKPNQLNFVFAPTMNCNYKCVYCFEQKFRNKSIADSKTLNNIKNFILNSAKSINSVKKVKITWFGGEPMLAYNQIIQLGSELKKNLSEKNISFSSKMVTNGSLLDVHKAKQLKEMCNLNSIQITLDGTEKVYCEKKGTNKENFYNVLDNIQNLNKLLEICIRLNVDKKNILDIYELTDYILTNYDLKDKILISFAPIRDYENQNLDSLFTEEEFIEEKMKYENYLFNKGYTSKKPNIPLSKFSPSFCGLIKTYNFAIDSEGFLYKCEHNLGRKDKVVGDVINGSYFNSNDEFLSATKRTEKCRTCKIFPVCRSGCNVMYNLITRYNCVHISKTIDSIKRMACKYIDSLEK